MERSKLYLSVRQARHLSAFGLNMSDAVYCWDTSDWRGETLSVLTEGMLKSSDIVPTYTLEELLQKMPISIEVGSEVYQFLAFMSNGKYYAKYSNEKSIYLIVEADYTLLTAVYELAALLLENGWKLKS